MQVNRVSTYSAVPLLAINYKIPLIFWGENPGLQLGDLGTLGSTGYDGNNLRHMNTLSGGTIKYMKDAGFSDKELISYRYPDADEFDANNIQIVYLGWIFKDWSLANNGFYSCSSGLDIRTDSPTNTGDVYGVSALDEDWVLLNQMIKYYKFGFGKATDYANEEIRLGRITRSDAIDMVKEYDGRCSDDYIKSFCDYLEITQTDFWEQVASCANTDLFEVRDPRTIILNSKLG